MTLSKEDRATLRTKVFHESLYLTIVNLVIGIMSFIILDFQPTNYCIRKSGDVLDFYRWMAVMACTELCASSLLFMIACCSRNAFYLTNLLFATFTIAWQVIGCFVFFNDVIEPCAKLNHVAYFGVATFLLRIVIIISTIALQWIAGDIFLNEF